MVLTLFPACPLVQNKRDADRRRPAQARGEPIQKSGSAKTVGGTIKAGSRKAPGGRAVPPTPARQKPFLAIGPSPVGQPKPRPRPPLFCAGRSQPMAQANRGKQGPRLGLRMEETKAIAPQKESDQLFFKLLYFNHLHHVFLKSGSGAGLPWMVKRLRVANSAACVKSQKYRVVGYFDFGFPFWV
jgi:hypothetical protein